ncbi:hypothetical protein Q0601_08705 [Paracoccus onubensis]|uniref:hypothetical protein n=1 Tax=Paracoccus onubensis TaxID=1675788 RepID=UPI0027304ED4|nr:hypothetical protein [Paracoccus onubensis]MDP0927247.1 hypothetical protein [Paracoccus onubensis]
MPGPIFFIPFFFFGITGFGLLAQPLLNAIMVFRVLPVSLRLSLLFLPLRLFLLTFCLFLLLFYRLCLGLGLLIAPQFQLFLIILFVLVLRVPALLCSIPIAGALLPFRSTFFSIALLLPGISFWFLRGDLRAYFLRRGGALAPGFILFLCPCKMRCQK